MINAVGRDIPDSLIKQLDSKIFEGSFVNLGTQIRTSVYSRTVLPQEKKLLYNIREAIKVSGLKDGMTISFHHHMRNGDYIVKMVLEEIDKEGIKDLTFAPSALFECHSFIEEYIKKGVIKKIHTNYITGYLADRLCDGLLEYPVIMRTHGGRDRALEAGDLKVDVAFIASPTADSYGNLNGFEGKSACGSLGYAFSDAKYASCSVAITDNLLPYPLTYVSIDQTLIDYVVEVESIGEITGIVSGTTQITTDPIGRIIANLTASVVEASGYFKNGFSLQTGAGGISLAATTYIHKKMKEKSIVGSFGLGGISKPMVDILEDNLFNVLLDTQCFDQEAIQSLKKNSNHREISCSVYSNPHTKGSVVNQLDIAILGATQIDLNYNVNVTTSSNGTIMGGSGGHADAAAGSKLSIIVTQLNRSRIPSVVENVNTVNTPGESIDVLVTDRGIAVNPLRQELKENLIKAGLPVKEIQELKQIADKLCGLPEPLNFDDKIIAAVEYRDGTLIDIIRKVI